MLVNYTRLLDAAFVEDLASGGLDRIEHVAKPLVPSELISLDWQIRTGNRLAAYLGDVAVLVIHHASDGGFAMSGKKVSGTICAKHPEGEFLAKGTGHFFPTRSYVFSAPKLTDDGKVAKQQSCWRCEGLMTDESLLRKTLTSAAAVAAMYRARDANTWDRRHRCSLHFGRRRQPGCGPVIVDRSVLWKDRRQVRERDFLAMSTSGELYVVDVAADDRASEAWTPTRLTVSRRRTRIAGRRRQQAETWTPTDRCGDPAVVATVRKMIRQKMRLGLLPAGVR